MLFDTPFGIRRQAGPSAGASNGSNVNTQRFATLKPICVELLGCVGPIASFETQNKAQALLQRLHNKLSHDPVFVETSATRTPLSLALISYVFFPIAQLLRVQDTLPGKRLPDRLQHVLYLVLANLCEDWWLAWSDVVEEVDPGRNGSPAVTDNWQVWDQLLLLAASAFGSPQQSKQNTSRNRSEETQQAALAFASALLAPRVTDVQARAPADAPRSDSDGPDWDDELDLPSLDDYDKIMEQEASKARSREMQAADNDAQVAAKLYPSDAQLSALFNSNGPKGALAHILMSSLTLARDTNSSQIIRVEALRLVQIIMVGWIAAEPDPSSCFPEVFSSARRYSLTPGQQLPSRRAQRSQARPEALSRIEMFLPGVVSGLVAILSAKPQQTYAPQSDVLAEALNTLNITISLCFADDRFSLSSNPQEVNEDNESARSLEELFVGPTGPAPIAANNGDVVATAKHQDAPGAALPANTKSHWTQSSVAHIAASFLVIASLSTHKVARVRLAFARLAGNVLSRCCKMLSYQMQGGFATQSPHRGTEETDSLAHLLTRCLVDIAADTNNGTKASHLATEKLTSFLGSSSGRTREILTFVEMEVTQSMRHMRIGLSSYGKESNVALLARRLSCLLRFVSSERLGAPADRQLLQQILAKQGLTDRWVLALLGSFEVDPTKAEDKGSGMPSITSLDGEATKDFVLFLEALGTSAARLLEQDAHAGPSSSLQPFMALQVALSNSLSRRPSRDLSQSEQADGQVLAPNGLLLADRMLRGALEVLSDADTSTSTGKASTRVRRRAQRLAKGIIEEILDAWDVEGEEMVEPSPLTVAGTHARLHTDLSSSGKDDAKAELQEYKKGDQSGYDQAASDLSLGPAINLGFVEHAKLSSGTQKSSRRGQALRARNRRLSTLDYSDALLLSIVSSCGKILGPGLRTMMLRLLYPIIGAMASGGPAVRPTATQCLDDLAHSAGYGSVQGCVLDHADYILGTASQRLVSTLAIELQAQAISAEQASGSGGLADGALIETRRGQEDGPVALMSARAAPLILVQVVRMLGSNSVALVEDAVDEVLDAIDKFHMEPTICDGLLGILDRLVEVMQADMVRSNVGSPRIKHGQTHGPAPSLESELADFERWMSKRCADAGAAAAFDEGEESASANVEGDKNEDPTRSQQVVVAMLKKALPFVSHSSSIIRMRCLRLINRGIDILCLQGRTVEPLAVISSLWPLLMARLGFTLSRVLLNADSKQITFESLDEQSLLVCIEGADIVGTLASHLADFLGSEKLMRQAMPRLLLLLKIVERGEDGSKAQRDAPASTSFRLSDSQVSSMAERKAVALVDKDSAKIRLFRPFSPLATLIEHVIVTLDKVIVAMGASMNEADLYYFATHDTLLSCLDVRQIDSIRKAAQHLFFETLSKRNENLVWFVLSAASAKTPAGGFPRFLRRDDLRIAWLE